MWHPQFKLNRRKRENRRRREGKKEILKLGRGRNTWRINIDFVDDI